MSDGDEDLPQFDSRTIYVVVRPGEEPEISFEGFAYWEAMAVLKRAFDLLDDADEELRYGGRMTFHPEGEEDDPLEGFS